MSPPQNIELGMKSASSTAHRQFRVLQNAATLGAGGGGVATQVVPAPRARCVVRGEVSGEGVGVGH